VAANGFYRRVRQLPSSQRIAIGSAVVQVVVNVSQVTDAIFIVATGLSQPAPFANFSALTMYLEVSLALFLNVPIGGFFGPFISEPLLVCAPPHILVRERLLRSNDWPGSLVSGGIPWILLSYW
jgi:hypothetical protein